MKNNIIRFFILLAIISFDCKKFLDEKPDQALAVPNSLKDLQALLDNASVMNNGVSYAIGEGSSDNYYLTNANWETLNSEADKSIYIWDKEIIYDYFPNEWSKTYRVVTVANLVLEKIEKIEKTKENNLEWNNVKGTALFHRAKSYLNLVTNWGKGFDLAKSKSDLGVPLRLSSDFNIPSTRATVFDCYEQVINDLTMASELLLDNVIHVMRPSKAATFALLSRAFLSMRDYVNAGRTADSCLRYFNQVLNYNDVNRNASFPFQQFNQEVIFHSTITLPQNLNNSRANIDSTLYRSYEDADIRKTAFFKSNGDGTYSFKGSYNGSNLLFDGIACDEIWLMRAECRARYGDLTGALLDLNRLLKNRYERNSFIEFSSNDQQEIISKILLERRKELLMRNLRWQDIKRLNFESGHQVVLKRKIKGIEYSLLPNDNKYALPLPAYILNLTGMSQNSR